MLWRPTPIGSPACCYYVIPDVYVEMSVEETVASSYEYCYVVVLNLQACLRWGSVKGDIA